MVCYKFKKEKVFKMNENFNGNLMCPRCGTANASNTKFCIRCGNSLQASTVENQNVPPIIEQNINPIQQTMTSNQNPQNSNPVQPQMFNGNLGQQINNPVPEQPMNSNLNHQMNNSVQQPVYQNVASSTAHITTGNLNYLQYIIGAILKPFDKFKKEEEKLNNFKNVGILSLIVIGVMTIIGLFKTMLSAVRVTSFWSGKVEWVWENLKNVEYFKVIGQSLLMYAGIILAIAGVYFVASLVMKKESKFVKLLSATVTAFIPFAVASAILSPLLSMINVYLGVIITIVGFIYFIVILLELVNDQIVIENKNMRIYFHLVCLSVLIIGGGLIVYKLILGTLTSGLGSLGSLLK